MILILDCDVISTFAKIDGIKLLHNAFPNSKFFITNSVYAELMRAKRKGFSFPIKVMREIPIITLNEKALKDFQNFSMDKRIHFGEAEGLSIAKNREAVFLTNDSLVVKFCEKNEIRVLNIKDVLTLIARKNILDKEEMLKTLRDIEEKDNTVIKDADEILAEYED